MDRFDGSRVRQIICPACKGQGAVTLIMTSKIDGVAPKRKLAICQDCDGTGMVYPGYVATQIRHAESKIVK